MVVLQSKLQPTEISIPHGFTPRDYQLPFLRAMDKGKKRAILVWHRRAGKDKVCINHAIKQMLRRVGTYYYYFPTSVMGRKVLWDGMDFTGMRFLDHFPSPLIDRISEQEMKIKLVNGSIFQIIGTDRLDVVGTNPVGCTFSEYSLQNPKAWEYVRPILAENGGWAVFNFTPRGHNHAKVLYDMATLNDEWFVSKLSVDDTKAVSPEAIDNERRSGMLEELIQQEFYCSFDYGQTGAYYAKGINAAKEENRILDFVPDKYIPVHTAWDLGVDDSTAIWFFQVCGNSIFIIDYMESHGEGLPYYIRLLKEKEAKERWVYGFHFAPHDIRVREFGTGQSRWDMAKELGVRFKVLTRISVDSGIEHARALIERAIFHRSRCKDGIVALENYRREWDDKLRAFHKNPLHDWTSHAADAFRYMATAVRSSNFDYTHERQTKQKEYYPFY